MHILFSNFWMPYHKLQSKKVLSNLHISKCMVRVDRKPTDSAIRDSIYRYVTLAKWWWRRALVMMIRLYVQLA